MRRLLRGMAVAALLFAGGFVYARFFMGPSPEELERLRREQRSLSEQLEGRLQARALAWEAPEATVLVSIPARVAEKLAGQVVAGLLREVRLRLRDLDVRKQDDVRAGALAGRRVLGRFDVSVHLAEVRARLRPGRPRLTFAHDRVDVALPVTIAEGSGSGRLRLEWDGRGMGGAVCGDFEATLDVAGRVTPVTHTLEGVFRLSAEEKAVVAKPEFGEVKLRVPIEPSPETWRAVDEVIAQRGAVCRAALRAADVREKLEALLARGLSVTLPRNVLAREIRLPAVVERPVELKERSMRLEVRPSGLRLEPTRLWYGAAVEVSGLTVEKAPDDPPL